LGGSGDGCNCTRDLILDSFSWNRSLASSVAPEYEKTTEVFQQMQHEGMNPNKFIFVHVLNAFANLQALEEGRHAHKQIIQSGCESDVFVGSSLIDMYAKCGSMEDASRVFNKITCDMLSWSAMLFGLLKSGSSTKHIGTILRNATGKSAPHLHHIWGRY
jgi:pentatricopeptide repeat protein